jgi:hypothetical protein
LSKLLALVAVCSAMLAAAAQASAADPVSGVLDAVGTTATQQLDAVTHSATSATVPVTPPVAVAQVPANPGQGVAVLQAVAGAAPAVGASAGGHSEPSRSGAPGESSARSEPSEARRPSSPASLLTVATRAGRVVAAPTPTPTPTPDEHAAVVSAASRIVSSRIDHVTSTLVGAARRTPAATTLADRTSRVAGALLGADVATSTRDTLAAIRVPGVASRLQAALPPNPTTLLPAAAGAGTSVAQPSFGPTALAASLATIGSAKAAPPFSAAPLGAQAVQQLTPQRQASAEPRGGVRGPRDTTMPSMSATPPSNTSLAKARAAVGADPEAGQAVPAPSPGGFAPASSASVAGGLSAATFLALAALLLLGAPRAVRRLRRTGASWRLAQFSLIPARPG